MLSIALIRRSADAVKYYEKDDYYTRESTAEATRSGQQLELDDSADGAPGRGSSGGDGGTSGDSGVHSGNAGGDGASRSSGVTDAVDLPDTKQPAPDRDDFVNESSGRWYGEAAQALGLEGKTESADLKDVLDGRLPNGVVLGRQMNGEWKHTPGWDLTFSAPKSVSILAEVGQDERIHDAHQRAVSEALDWTEDNSIGARVPSTAGTIFERTGSMLVARFTHHTSRNQDPNLHTHALVANATLTPEGQWRSVHSREFFNNKMAAGQIYRAALARELLALGYVIEKTHTDGRFEVIGVPKELVDEMSSRRTQIESKLAEWGAADAETAAKAALVTRPHKRDVPLSHLIAAWRQATNARGFDVDDLVAAAKERGPQTMSQTTDPKTLLRESILKMSEPEAVFRHGDLVGEILARGVGQLDVKAAEKLIDEARRGVPLRQVDEGGIRLWTTTTASAQEKRSLAIAAGVDRSVKPYLSPERAGEILKDRQLTEGQLQAAALILTTDSPHIGVVGRPGTGKTTLLKTVREQLERQGIQVIGMAQNANAASNLEREAGIESSTIHKHLREIAPRLARASSTGMFDRLYTELTRRDEIWIIDESSQLPNNLFNRVLQAADKLGARTVFVGDTRQLSAIEAGKPFELALDRGMPYVQMSEIVRQRNEADRAIVHDAIAERVAPALDKLASRTHEVKDKDDRLKAVVGRWLRDPNKRESTVVITTTNKERAAIVERIRDALRVEGRIPGEVARETLEKVWGYRMDARDASFYKPSHVVRFGAENTAINARAGSYWNVLAVDTKRNVLLLEDSEGQRRLWNPREDGARASFAPVVFERRSTTLAAGEKVRWSQNNDALGLVNGQRLTVEAVKQSSTTFRTEDGKKIEVSHAEDSGKHWTHAYASTLYSAQGLTADHAIVQMSSESARLISQRLFVVAVSRQRDSIALYTDSRPKLQEVLERNMGDKSSAVEAAERHHQVNDAQRLEKEMARQRAESEALQESIARSRPQHSAENERKQSQKEDTRKPPSRERARGRDDTPRPPPVLER
jgi:conjugative relaxase-like TrwC/TraI family protein